MKILDKGLKNALSFPDDMPLVEVKKVLAKKFGKKEVSKETADK